MDYEAWLHDELERLLHAEPRQLPLSFLRAITNNFDDSRKIGVDEFYNVYMGVLLNGTIVAVKRMLESVDMDEEIFKNEVECLVRVKHKNIVRLLGYSETQGKMVEYNGRLVMSDVRQRLLCFENLRGQTLDAYITDASHGLGWRERYKIIKGICEGLYHLHQKHIVHLHLTPANIYLDENMLPAIYNFGRSMRLDEKESMVFRKYISWSGEYTAPESILNGVITLKTDIYSLGVLIIEILTGRQVLEPFEVESVLESWSDRLGMSLENTRLQQVRVCTEIGMRCLYRNLVKRPIIADIIDMLAETENETESTNEFTEPDETESTDELTSDDEKKKTTRLLQDTCKGRGLSMDNLERMHMPYEVLKEITGGFSENCLVGRGAFGQVYKGKDRNGQEIAVKVLRQSLDLDGSAFGKEFQNLIKLKHPNIVRLVGFCNEDEEVIIKEYIGKPVKCIEIHRALCFEYLHNGSLQNRLYDESQGFDWKQRYKIIEGVCMGLKYLHMELEGPMYHLDLKPDNILLDNDMVPKIADFGLSRLLGEEKTIQTLSPLGTLGYCPPEFLMDQKISKEFDIFSLGVIIIKIMCGPAGYSKAYTMRQTKFIRRVIIAICLSQHQS